MILSSVYEHMPDLVSRKTGNEYIIVPLRGQVADMNSLFTLNETGAFIWELIDGEKDVAQIVCCLMEEYGIEEPVARHDVVELLEKMEGKVVQVAFDN
ncbi:MAG: PqqD family protein [Bacteroidetes bacterium]|nr:PqqD family protein [Bacteroidota bacterium]